MEGMDYKLLKTGVLVEVEAFGKEVLQRRVVEVVEDTVYVCREEEWKIAKTERREPVAVGFNKRFVVNIFDSSLPRKVP